MSDKKEKVLGGWHTSLGTAISLKQFGLAARFIVRPASERADLVKSAIDVAVMYSDDEAAAGLCSLYRCAILDTHLAKYHRRYGSVQVPTGSSMDSSRYSEHFVEPKDPEWHKGVQKAQFDRYRDLFNRLPEVFEGAGPSHFAFPKLKQYLLDGILEAKGQNALLTTLLCFGQHSKCGEQYGEVFKRAREFYSDYIRKGTDRCDHTFCSIYLKQLDVFNLSENKIAEMLARSLLVRRAQAMSLKELGSLVLRSGTGVVPV